MKAGLKGKYWIFYSAVAAGTVKWSQNQNLNIDFI